MDTLWQHLRYARRSLLRTRTHSFAGMTAWRGTNFALVGAGEPEEVVEQSVRECLGWSRTCSESL